MNDSRPKQILKSAVGILPYVPELFQNACASSPPDAGYRVDELERQLPDWLAAAQAFPAPVGVAGKRIFIFGYLRWWVEYAVPLGLLLHRLGHRVTFGYLPFRRWSQPVSAFDRRRQSAYLRRKLRPLSACLDMVDLSQGRRSRPTPQLERFAGDQAMVDVQYTLQREELDLASGGEADSLYRLRRERNLAAACAFEQLAQDHTWDTVLLPNGSILEFGMLYRVARAAGLRVVTYEFGEQRQRIWLAVDDEVMRQDTTRLWERNGDRKLKDSEVKAVAELYAARTAGRTWGNFARQWQAGEREGGEAVRKELGLHPDRTTVLLCTNVVGDSLALNRQVYTRGMSDWLGQTVKALAERTDVDLIVRVHPGELLGAGHPSVDIVRERLPQVPEHVRLIAPDSPVNTYDLIEVAQVGLVYTTTVGLEMAMRGLPVLVSGQTHYRGKGFTLDPNSRQEYFSILDQVIANPTRFRLSQDQIDCAWHYAYLFFFRYPKAFPWHLIGFWEDIQKRPPASVFPVEELRRYQEAIAILAGTEIGGGDA